MRADTATFHSANVAPQKSPRFVAAIIFDVESIYITSHTGILSVPGVVLDGALQQPSALSQRIVPDQGRSEIGSMSFTLVDLDSSFTDEARDKLDDGKGLRGKEVRLYVGYEGLDFTQFQRFQTQVVADAEYDEGVYSIQCRDITREQRKEIFEPKKTTLRDSVSATATTVPVYVTTDFETVLHGASYSDAPSTTVGYIKIGDEVIRYTGKTADSFTGCSRGALNTRAVEHQVDSGTAADRRPKVEELIYLELPAAKLAYAILTGVLYDDTATLPDHWHLGIDADWVRLSDFTGIGADLWDPTLDTSGFIARFANLKKTDGKKFLESELYQLLGCYSPIYSDGTIGLRRMNHVLADAPFVVELTEKNCVSWSGLKHEMDGMHNVFRVDWNSDGEEFTRRNQFIDADSADIHGEAPIKELKFKGLHGARHTDAIVRTRIDALRDRYTYPPETMTVTVLPSLNRLEVGDIVRVKLPTVRDFAGPGENINRSFEIQQKSEDFATGNVRLQLFGSTGRASVDAPTTDASPLPDGYYTAEGTELSTVCTINVVGDVGVIQPGTYDLTGNADMNNAGAVYYYAGDLELGDGATLTINNNVQLRVRGFFTVNGDIDGVGRGKAGVADSAGWLATQAGTPGFIGNSRGMDGVTGRNAPLGGLAARTASCAFTQGQYSAFPLLDLSVSGTSLLGIPGDLRGTSGGAGGKIGLAASADHLSGTVVSLGGDGADSGAGLAIICRGVGFGASALIDLSGADSAATSIVSGGVGRGFDLYPGSGGAGSPGGLFIGLDGAGISIPDLGGKFVAACGAVPITGSPMPLRAYSFVLHLNSATWTDPGTGYLDESYISDVDLSNSAHRIQYIPESQTPAEDAPELPPPITGLSAEGVELGNLLTATLPPVDAFDTVEYYGSLTNVRGDATLVGSIKGSIIRHQLAATQTRYYWARTARGALTSDWYPTSATAGVSATSLPGPADGVDGVDGTDGVDGADGLSVAELAIYRRATSAPSTPTGGSYAFSTQTLTPPSSWTSDIPAGNNPVYASRAVASVTGVSGTDSSLTWSTPVLVTQEGGGVDIIFIRAATQPSTPSPSSGTPGSWYSDVNSVPAGTGLIWSSVGTRENAGQNWTWQTPVRVEGQASPWIARGNCVAGLSTAGKIGGTSLWDSDVRSSVSNTVCHVKFKPSQTNAALMVALNTDPITDQSYTSLNFAWYCRSDGIVQIYQSGASGAAYGAYTTATELAITYDGSNVRFYKDRVLQLTVAIASQTFFADSSFNSPGGSVNSLHFGPGVSLETVDTSGLGPNAATGLYSASDAGLDSYDAGTVPGSPNWYLRIDLPALESGYVLRATMTTVMRPTVAGTIASASMILDWGAGTQASDIAETGTGDTVFRSFTVQAEFTSLPAGSTSILTMRVGASGSAVNQYKYSRVLVEVIKR